MATHAAKWLAQHWGSLSAKTRGVIASDFDEAFDQDDADRVRIAIGLSR